MLYFMTTRDHRYTLYEYRKGRGQPVRDRITIRPYEARNVRLTRGTYIFSDLERLSGWQLRRTARLATRLRSAGCQTLNDPGASLMRVDLLRALQQRGHQSLAVARRTENLAGLSFPVFLRGEADHDGNLTDLLRNPPDLEKALGEQKDALAVEFVDTADSEGVYRKYSAFRVGDRIIPRHVFFSRHWMQKQADLTNPAYLEEERAYVDANPHRDAVLAIFELARIDYGRVDYSMLNGRPIVWEINTNPSLAGPISDLKPEREAVHAQFADRMNRCLAELDASGPEPGRLILNPNVWRRPPWLS
ncbi:MAG: hypothetical protein ABFS14_08555 [Gemmatimonadota bacterium]